MKIMVDFRIIDTLSMHRYPPKSPRKQGDFGKFERGGVIGKWLLISLIHHKSVLVARFLNMSHIVIGHY